MAAEFDEFAAMPCSVTLHYLPTITTDAVEPESDEMLGTFMSAVTLSIDMTSACMVYDITAAAV